MPLRLLLSNPFSPAPSVSKTAPLYCCIPAPSHTWVWVALGFSQTFNFGNAFNSFLFVGAPINCALVPKYYCNSLTLTETNHWSARRPRTVRCTAYPPPTPPPRLPHSVIVAIRLAVALVYLWTSVWAVLQLCLAYCHRDWWNTAPN